MPTKITSNRMKVSDMLRGCEPQRIQSVGFMQVIPLTSDIEDTRFASPAETLVSTQNYGSIVFNNPTPKSVIIPAQTAYVVKHAAQDHAMTGVGYIPKSKKIQYETAVCIQRNQGGLIPAGNHMMIVLPFALREKAHASRNEKDYSRLWPHIEAMNIASGLHTGAQVVDYLTHFKKELDRFVAEFEPVPKQVGAIIIVDGAVVGIERAPNYDFWKSVWRPLIRECYGSFALSKANDRKEAPVPATRSVLRKAKNLSDLKAALKEAEQEEYEKVKSLVEDVCATELNHVSRDESDSVDVDSWQGDRFVGQTVKDGPQVVYGSIIATEAWRKHAKWNEASPFKM